MDNNSGLKAWTFIIGMTDHNQSSSLYIIKARLVLTGQTQQASWLCNSESVGVLEPSWCSGSCCSEELNTTSPAFFLSSFFFSCLGLCYFTRWKIPNVWGFFFCQWTKIKYAFMFHKRAKAKSNNPRDWNRFSVTWRTAKNLKASLIWCDLTKGERREKLDPRLHTCTPCAWRANTGERLSRLWLDLSAQKHSVTHALASASVDRANTVCVTHTAAAGGKLGSRRPPRLSRRRITRRSCLRIGRSGRTPASSITFLLLIPLVSARWQTQMFSCSFFPCVLKSRLWFMGALMKSYGPDSDQSCRCVRWWETVTQSTRKCNSRVGWWI